MINIAKYKSPFGELIIGSFDNQICLCDWRYRKKRELIDRRIQQGLSCSFEEGETPIIKETIKQLDLYFQGELKEFNIPLKMVGSDFQVSVWRELMKINYGETRSYLQLSNELGDQKAIRAVATANGANAISIIVPCHRVIGSDGSLTGYAGGLSTKEKLLKLEGAAIFNQQSLF